MACEKIVMNALFRGNSRVVTVVVKDSLGVPIDISTDTLVMSIRQSHKSTDPYILQKTNGVGQHTDPVNGKTQFNILDTESELFPSRQLLIDVTWLLSNGDTLTIVDAFLPIIEPVRIPT